MQGSSRPGMLTNGSVHITIELEEMLERPSQSYFSLERTLQIHHITSDVPFIVSDTLSQGYSNLQGLVRNGTCSATISTGSKA